MNIVFRNSTEDTLFDGVFFKKIIVTGIRELKINNNISLSINLVKESEIQELNKKYRNTDQITDVLSFPMINGDFKKLQVASHKLPATIDIGDIFICLPFAKKQAKLENVNIEQKLIQLTAHGFLHLLEYDHERSEKDAKDMFNLEKIILEKCSK